MASTVPRQRQRQRKTSQAERICPVCSQSFRKADHLARHFRSHTKERPFMCPVCSKLYVRRDTLLRHTRSQHGNDLEQPTDPSIPDLLPVQSIDYPVENTCDHDALSAEWPTFWSGQWDEDWTSLLAADEFDLNAVNQTLLAPTDQSIDPAVDPVADSATGLTTVQRGWHTFCETKALSSRASPEPSGARAGAGAGATSTNHLRTHADDQYRQELVESLRPRVQAGILPSTTFLDFCLQAYFSNFQPIFPLIHAPTFQPSRENAVLLLSMCSIGSLFLGSSKAVAHGISMYERLHKAILASWDTYIQSPNPAHLYPIQASVIGQTFGFLMGRPRDLVGIEFFHGTIVAWARKARLFDFDEDPIGEVENLQDDSDALRSAWKKWARLEERKRIVLALHIHDAEFAKLHHHEPVFRHAPEKLPQLAVSEMFAAPCAKSWKGHLLASKTPVQDTARSSLGHFPQNDFLSYAMLESFEALAYDRSCGPSGRAAVHHYEVLIEWYRKYAQISNASKHPDHLCLIILWHSVFMHLDTDFNQLECALGREGESTAQRSRPYACRWAQSSGAARALLHATLVQQHFQLLPIGAEPAIHVPMALYNCGIAWTCFTRFGASFVDTTDLSSSEFPELKLLGHKQMKMFQEIRSNVQLGKAESGPLLKIIDLLGKISHWKVAGSFATTLMALVDTHDLF
ncbi:hypothetical protein BDV18DRAFT_159666 [Aspergillus unguis]